MTSSTTPDPIFITHIAINFDGPSDRLEKWLAAASIEFKDRKGERIFFSRVYKTPMAPSPLPVAIDTADLGEWCATRDSRVSLTLSNGHTIEGDHFGVCGSDDGNGRPYYLCGLTRQQKEMQQEKGGTPSNA